jgi:predicted kinase
MELILTIGLQASGKSTFARGRFAATHMYISRDLLPKQTNTAHKQLRLIEEALQQGHSVVIDNTNPTREVRADIIALARQYAAEVVGYYFAVQVQECLARNRARSGTARVPDVAIFATLKRLVRPILAEGFDRLYYIKNNGDGTFAVSDWVEENEVNTGEDISKEVQP